MAKKKTTKVLKEKKAAYLREIQVRFKKKRVDVEAPAGEPVTDPENIVRLFRDLQNEGKEKLIAISLNTKLTIIAFEVVSIGSVTAVYAQPGECTRTPVMVGATSMVMVHNHPSGDPTPSEPDKDFTWNLTMACETLRIPLHDHIIIGDDDFYSFANDGWIEKYQRQARKQIDGQRPKR